MVLELALDLLQKKTKKKHKYNIFNTKTGIKKPGAVHS